MRYSLLSVALLLAASSASPLSGVVGKRQTLDARDSRENCGKTLDGSAAGGNGIWCPVDQYLERVTEFCEAKAGTTVPYNGQISQTYGITLTNEYDSSVPGDAGHLVCEFFPLCLPDFFFSCKGNTKMVTKTISKHYVSLSQHLQHQGEPYVQGR